MEQKISALEEQRWQAMLASDVETLVRLLSPKLAYTHSNMTTDSKDAYIKKVAEGYYRYLEIIRENERVSIVGDTAIITGHLRAKIEAGGTPRQLDNLYLAVWAKDGANWQFLAYQPTVFPKTL